MKNDLPSLSILAGVLLSLSLPGTSSAGSLWVSEHNNERGMFGDKTAKNIGDILTIVVSDATVTTKAQEIKTYSQSTNGWGAFVSGLFNGLLQAGNQMAGIALTKPASGSSSGNSSSSGGNSTASSGNSTVSITSPLANVSIPTFDLTAKSDFDAGGSTTDRLTFDARVAVTVVDVLPNGNIVVEGGKILHVGKDTQYVSVHGIVRTFDIQPDNTVASTAVADAQIESVPAGDLTDAQKKGWLARFYDKVRPFN